MSTATAKRAAHLAGKPLTADQDAQGLPMSALIGSSPVSSRSSAALLRRFSVPRCARCSVERKSASAWARRPPIASLASLAFCISPRRYLGNRAKAYSWLTSKSRALNGEIPLYMLDTDIGTDRAFNRN